jgi:hypothetical protein
MVTVFAAVGYAGAVNSAYCNGADEYNRPVSTELEHLELNFDSIQEVYVSDDDIIELETSDSTLLSGISNLFVIDNCLYIHSDNVIRVFDFTGEYLFDDIESSRIMGKPDYYQQYDSSIYFMQQESTDEPCLCKFNITTHQTRMYHFNIKNRNFVQRSFFKIIDGLAYIEFCNVENSSQNPLFLKIKLLDL